MAESIEKIVAHNSKAWDKLSDSGDRWTVAVGPEVIAAARQGEFAIYLTESIPMPRSWLPPLADLNVLCLASGGGEQGPILAAAGAAVTVFDNSERQLAADRLVAEREGLALKTVRGDMRDLSVFDDGAFDLVLHPTSNLFVPDIRPVWREAFRVLRDGGSLLAGFLNPFEYIFDRDLADEGTLEVKYGLPYSDVESLSEAERRRLIEAGEPLEFSHTLDDQIGGQLAAGFVLTGFYESRRETAPIARYVPSYIATRAHKPA